MTDAELIERARDGNYVGITAACKAAGVRDKDRGWIEERLRRLERAGVLVRHPQRLGWTLEQTEMELN